MIFFKIKNLVRFLLLLGFFQISSNRLFAQTNSSTVTNTTSPSASSTTSGGTVEIKL